MENNRQNYLKLKKFAAQHPINSTVLIYGEFVFSDFISSNDQIVLGKIVQIDGNAHGFQVEIYDGQHTTIVDLVTHRFTYEVLA